MNQGGALGMRGGKVVPVPSSRASGAELAAQHDLRMVRIQAVAFAQAGLGAEYATADLLTRATEIFEFITGIGLPELVTVADVVEAG